MFKIARQVCVAAVIATGALSVHDALAGGLDGVVVTPLMTKEMANIPGKEVLMMTVEYAPGAADPVHRHDAHGFIYVLEGSIVMGVKGGKEVTLMPGQTFHEGPDDIHTVGRNASKTKPAKFLVMLVKNKGVSEFLPVN